MRIGQAKADHGGGVDAAVAQYGGRRGDWLDLSTGINRRPYPMPKLTAGAWRDLPDAAATLAIESAARRFWQVPDGAAILAASGASSLIARIPALMPAATVAIPAPTYNEHARAFVAAGWRLTEGPAAARVLVHPNNPDGRLWSDADCDAPLMVIDESFCDTMPEHSLIALAARPGTIVLKSFGKFWGLAGGRLGFAIGDPALLSRLADLLGPWPVSGPALAIGAAALADPVWAEQSRARLARDAARLDRLMLRAGAKAIGGTTLFRLYDTGDASLWQDHLAKHYIWTRRFPYSDRWLRLGLPGRAAEWKQLEQALADGPSG